jgi:hypothetical protein
MAEGLIGELYAALKEFDPRAYYSYGAGNSRWVLSDDTFRGIVEYQGGEVPDPTFRILLLGLPVRIDDTVDRFALETIE